MYIEMSLDMTHGGGLWSFPLCVWAPTKKEDGASWAYWSNIELVRKDDLILHLRGKDKDEAAFIGYSVASGDGYKTEERPPFPGDWKHARSFYRADLHQFTMFPRPITLKSIFEKKEKELLSYVEKNKKKATKKNLFCVKQSGKLQRQNGGYLSHADRELIDILFDEFDGNHKSPSQRVRTGDALRLINDRLGQQRFSKLIKACYGYKCCFPGCDIDDSRFLVGSHIARWSDNKELRGDPGNGLCLCLMHDRAFELGAFTLDEAFRIFVSPAESSGDRKALDLTSYHGQKIKMGVDKPLVEALREHWDRTKLNPANATVPLK
ncbi:HNH endonuclease [Rhizobium sp. CF142]|uniref:HNH endonuclease n=1 Tax=Rhizobium sp. CF142 TaxID=1144314 RepID=UPI00026EF649|nr:HNH endonuclease [Rhizobium sp. CF142]EJJ28952.1 hypothetical protein PMI11_02877 [Rhizobium sp. CF142]